jgi:hypothetical protein
VICFEQCSKRRRHRTVYNEVRSASPETEPAAEADGRPPLLRFLLRCGAGRDFARPGLRIHP